MLTLQSLYAPIWISIYVLSKGRQFAKCISLVLLVFHPYILRCTKLRLEYCTSKHSLSLRKVPSALLIFCSRHSYACAHTYFRLLKYHGEIGMSHHVYAYDMSLLFRPFHLLPCRGMHMISALSR